MLVIAGRLYVARACPHLWANLSRYVRNIVDSDGFLAENGDETGDEVVSVLPLHANRASPPMVSAFASALAFVVSFVSSLFIIAHPISYESHELLQPAYLMSVARSMVIGCRYVRHCQIVHVSSSPFFALVRSTSTNK